MESLGVISRVDKPSQWSVGMVIIPEKNNIVRICADLKPLNESVPRETNPFLSVDETLDQLFGDTIFSKLNVNIVFFQILLASSNQKEHYTQLMGVLQKMKLLE